MGKPAGRGAWHALAAALEEWLEALGILQQKPGAQPSGTDSFRQTAGSGQGAATGHSQGVSAECLGLLGILESTHPGQSRPLSRRSAFTKKYTPQSKQLHAN